MNKQPEIDSPPQNLTCARCGTAFSCGAAAGQSECWCFHLPRVRPVPTSQAVGCWCPSCLQAALDEQGVGEDHVSLDDKRIQQPI